MSTETELVAAIEARTPAVIVVPLDREGHGVPLLRCALRVAPTCTDVVVVGSPRAVAGPLSDPWTSSGIRAVLPASSDAGELAEGIAAVDALPVWVRAPDVPPAIAGSPEDGPALGPDALARLTPREHEVLDLLAQGRSTREIADAMSVSVNTVRSHVNVLLHKLGVHSRLRAVALFTAGPGDPRAVGPTNIRSRTARDHRSTVRNACPGA